MTTQENRTGLISILFKLPLISTFAKRVKTDIEKPAEESIRLRQLLFAGQLTAMTGLAWTGGLGLWIPFILATLILGFGHRYAYRQRYDRPKHIRVLFVIVLHLAFCYMFFGLLVGLPYPQAQMAMFGMAVTGWEMFTRQNLYTGWLLALCNIYVTAVLSRTMIFALFLLIFITLFLLFLWLADGDDAKQKDNIQIIRPPTNQTTTLQTTLRPWWRLGGRFLAIMLLLGSAVFLFTPRFAGVPVVPPLTIRVPMRSGPSGQVINPALPVAQVEGVQQQGSSDYYFGFDSRVDLSYRGGLNTTIMMYVRSPTWSYWRSHAYDHYDGRTWTQSNINNVRVMRDRRGRPTFTLTEDPPPGDQFLHTFYLQQPMPNLVFHGGTPIELLVPSTQIAIDPSGGIRVGEPFEAGTAYSVISVQQSFDPDLLRTAGTNYPPEITAQYLQLPDTVTDRTRAFAHQLTAAAPTPYDKVITIRDHLLTTYPYDYFPPPQAPNTDSVDQFLFVDQTGFCEHYVSAMVVMLRELGIPTRFVAGYGSGQFNRVTNYYEVRASDAHSWVEVYFPEIGWVPFDPTPGWTASPQTAPVPTWAFSSLTAGIDLPEIPLGAIASRAAAVMGVVGLPLLWIISLVALWFLIQWLRNRYTQWQNQRPTRYSKLPDAQNRTRRRILTTYKRAQRQLNAPRHPTQTVQEHATTHPDLDPLAEAVDIAAYRPQPPEESWWHRIKNWRKR